jgi:hypothetical protein
MKRILTALLLFGCLVPGTWSCQSRENGDGGEGAAPPLVERAQEFRSLIDREDYEAARAMMTTDPSRWWDRREGEGEPWKIGPKTPGPWANWDDELRSRKEIVEWKEGPDSASVVMRETNDYFRLLERGWVTNEVTYYFDDSGRIEGLLIRGLGERPPGRTEEFLSWAAENEPEELEALMPDGEVDPSGDHPQRFRELLRRWREDTGLEPIE